jgi:hypothetical protein
LLTTARRPRDGERGQTLPVWTFAVLTSLGLIFFSMATAMLSEQALQWNKMTAILYAADVEEWRIRNLIAGMIDAANKNGGCGTASVCLNVYTDLRAQYIQAVNRYTSDIQALQGVSTITTANQTYDAKTAVDALRYVACGETPVRGDCEYSYHVIDYSQRSAVQQVGKDAIWEHVGGENGTSRDSTPVSAWEPAQVEVAACETVKPVVAFSVFGYTPQATSVAARAAATLIPITSEWLAPGVIINPLTNAVFQATEKYSAYDTSNTSTTTPRYFYETTYPAQNYTAVQDVNFGISNSSMSPSFMVHAAWWSVIPIAPYSTASQTTTSLCTQDAAP